MSERCMHLDYDHVIPLTSKGKFQPKTNMFPENNNALSIKPYCVWVEISEKKYEKNQFFQLRFCYHKLENTKKFTLSLETSFKTLNDMIIGTAGTYLFESFTNFQSEWNNDVEIWVPGAFPDAARGISRQLYKVTLILILH